MSKSTQEIEDACVYQRELLTAVFNWQYLATDEREKIRAELDEHMTPEIVVEGVLQIISKCGFDVEVRPAPDVTPAAVTPVTKYDGTLYTGMYL